MRSEEGLELVQFAINNMNARERARFVNGIPSVVSELGSLATMPRVELNLESSEAFTKLSPEQQEKAGKLTIAMAEKFHVHEYDFCVIETTNEDKTSQFTVVYSAPVGLYSGSWVTTFKSTRIDEFMIEVNGKSIDTRTGMTWDVYKAFIDHAKSKGMNSLPDSKNPLPDSRECPVDGSLGKGRSCTWLTGEATGSTPQEMQAKGSRAYVEQAIAVIDDNLQYIGRANLGQSDYTRFRPTAVIELDN